MNVLWNQSTSATRYYVSSCVSNTCETFISFSTSTTLTALKPGTQYTLTVIANGPGGNSSANTVVESTGKTQLSVLRI